MIVEIVVCEKPKWFHMISSYSFHNTNTNNKKMERVQQDCSAKPKTLIGASISALLHQLFQTLGHQDRLTSFQKYVLVYLLLARNEYLISYVEKNSDPKKKRPVTAETLTLEKNCYYYKEIPNPNSNPNSSDCFLPGLHDDIALDCLALISRSDYPSLSFLNKKFNALISSGYLYKLRRKMGKTEHWVYLACSLMPWQAFDPSRNRWMRLPRMPCDECFSCADKESLAVGTHLLVFGREITGLAIWMYSLVSRDWSKCRPMTLPRCLFGSGSLSEVAIVAGGSDMNGRVLKSAELYNSELRTWETLPDMNLPRRLCSGFFMDKKFYVIGGMSSNTDSLTCGEVYDLETMVWTRVMDMYPGGNRATQSPPLVAVVNNQLYGADQSLNVVKKYDKVSNTWSVVKPLPVRADSSNGWGLAFKACGDRLLVIGGHRGPQGEVIVLHSWCPEGDPNRGEGDWEVLSVRERAGAFVYNCAIMGC